MIILKFQKIVKYFFFTLEFKKIVAFYITI